jgi:hypothetical protein
MHSGNSIVSNLTAKEKETIPSHLWHGKRAKSEETLTMHVKAEVVMMGIVRFMRCDLKPNNAVSAKTIKFIL